MTATQRSDLDWPDVDRDKAATNNAQWTQAPPQDQPAERAVLGAALLQPALIPELAGILRDDDWYHPAHRAIWDTITDLHATGHPVDVVTVATSIGTDRVLHALGGPVYVSGLADAIPAISSATYYARVISDRAVERRTTELGTWLHQAGHNGTDRATVEDRITKHLADHNPADQAALSSWAPFDLDDILDDAADSSPRPTLITGRDGASLLYAGFVHSVAGEPGCGKSWLADLGVVQEIANGHDIAYLDFEDRPNSLVQRLRDLGANDKDIRDHVRYIRPETALDVAGRTHLTAAVTGTTLVVVDGITEAMTLHGLSLLDNEDVARWLDLIPRRLADLGPAVLQIDHVVKKSDDRGRYAIGGQHKLAGITGVAYKMITIHSFGRGVKGKARLIIDKDRHGHVGPNGATAAELTLDATAPGLLYAWLDAPGGDHGQDGEWRPTGYMEKVSRYIEISPGATYNSIQGVVRGKKDHIRAAIQALLAEGYLRTEDGPRKSVKHYIEKPFREEQRDPLD